MLDKGFGLCVDRMGPGVWCVGFMPPVICALNWLMGLFSFGKPDCAAGVFTATCDIHDLAARLAQVPFRPLFVLGFVSPHVPIDTVSSLLREVFPEATVLLASSAGELSSEAPQLYCPADGKWLTLTLQFFDRSVFDSVELIRVPLGGEDLRKGQVLFSLHDRVEEITRALLAAEIHTPIHHLDTLAYTVMDGLGMSESFFIEAVYRSGRFPCVLVGGSAGTSSDSTDTFIHDGSSILQNHAVIALLKMAPHVRFGIFKTQNFILTENYLIVEDASTELRYVDTVRDHSGKVVNVVDGLCAALSVFPETLMDALRHYALAVRIGEELFVRTVGQVDLEKRRVHFYCDVAPGERLCLVKKVNIVEQTKADLNAFLEGKPRLPFAGILNDCVCRRQFNTEDLPALSEVFPRVNLAGFSTLGEILGLNINLTLTAVFFFRVSGGDSFSDKYQDNFIHDYAEWSSFFKVRNILAVANLLGNYVHEGREQLLFHKSVYEEVLKYVRLALKGDLALLGRLEQMVETRIVELQHKTFRSLDVTQLMLESLRRIV